MGLVGSESQPLTDIVLPILFVNGKNPEGWHVKVEKISQLFANWRNRAKDATPPHIDPYKTYPGLNKDLPTIFLWHQFSSEQSQVVTPQAERVNHPGRYVYFFDVYGIGPDVYRGVTWGNKAEYLQFIGCEDMYRDVPYTFQEYIDNVEYTKPRWSAKSFEQTVG